MAYAENTSVSVEKTRAEIESLLRRHKCSQFVVGVDDEQHQAMVQFRTNNRIIRFRVHLPDPKDRIYQKDHNGWQLAPSGIAKKVQQGERSRWRALLLVIKAKLESVESKIATFEEEFMANIVLPNDRTVAEMVNPIIEQAYATGQMPSGLMLSAPGRQSVAGEIVGEVVK